SKANRRNANELHTPQRRRRIGSFKDQSNRNFEIRNDDDWEIFQIAVANLNWNAGGRDSGVHEGVSDTSGRVEGSKDKVRSGRDALDLEGSVTGRLRRCREGKRIPSSRPDDNRCVP